MSVCCSDSSFLTGGRVEIPNAACTWHRLLLQRQWRQEIYNNNRRQGLLKEARAREEALAARIAAAARLLARTCGVLGLHHLAADVAADADADLASEPAAEAAGIGAVYTGACTKLARAEDENGELPGVGPESDDGPELAAAGAAKRRRREEEAGRTMVTAGTQPQPAAAAGSETPLAVSDGECELFPTLPSRPPSPTAPHGRGGDIRSAGRCDGADDPARGRVGRRATGKSHAPPLPDCASVPPPKPPPPPPPPSSCPARGSSGGRPAVALRAGRDVAERAAGREGELLAAAAAQTRKRGPAAVSA